jgi:hypothetical protein
MATESFAVAQQRGAIRAASRGRYVAAHERAPARR